MKILSLFILLIASLYSDQLIVSKDKCDQNITHHRLFICYNYTTKTANYVTYYATGDEVSRKNSKRLSFKPDPKIPEEYRADNSDYYKSGYDKFHLCEDSIMDFNKTLLADTYYLSNVVPGNPYVNRHRWSIIENQERKFYESHKGYSYSITGVVFTTQGIFKTIGKHKIGIPDYFYKCFFSRSSNPLYNYDYQCYLMPNSKELVKRYKELKYYNVTLDFIREITGLDIKFIVSDK